MKEDNIKPIDDTKHLEIKEQAKKYRQFNFSITPVCSYNHEGMSLPHKEKCGDPGKAAILKGWKSIKANDKMIDEWFERFPTENIGTLLGSKTGYVAVDIDGQGGETIFHQLSHGKDYDTWDFTTPGGGRRLMFKIPESSKEKVFNRVHFSDEKGGECTFMGEFQQTVLPPSIHRNKGIYKWNKSPYDTKCEVVPDWVANIMTKSKDKTTYDGLD